MLVWAYHQKVSRLKNVAEKLKIRYGKNKTISVRVKGRPHFHIEACLDYARELAEFEVAA